jgi:metal-responsive CopG/Arc/MetJ family transcriptional regulator
MEKQKISLNIPVEVLNRVDRLAEMADIDRSKLIVNIIDETSRTLEDCGKVGVYQLAVLMRNLSGKMNEWAEQLKKKKVDLL